MVADIPEPPIFKHRKSGDGGPFAVWLVWGALLGGGLVAGNLSITGAGDRSEFGRLGSSVGLVVAGWLLLSRWSWPPPMTPRAGAMFESRQNIPARLTGILPRAVFTRNVSS